MSVNPNVSRAEADILVPKTKKNASKHESCQWSYIRMGRDNEGALKNKIDAYFVVLPYTCLSTRQFSFIVVSTSIGMS